MLKFQQLHKRSENRPHHVICFIKEVYWQSWTKSLSVTDNNLKFFFEYVFVCVANYLHIDNTKVLIVWNFRILSVNFQHFFLKAFSPFSFACLYSVLRYSFMHYCFLFSILLLWCIRDGLLHWCIREYFRLHPLPDPTSCFPWPCFCKWLYNRRTEWLT